MSAGHGNSALTLQWMIATGGRGHGHAGGQPLSPASSTCDMCFPAHSESAEGSVGAALGAAMLSGRLRRVGQCNCKQGGDDVAKDGLKTVHAPLQCWRAPEHIALTLTACSAGVHLGPSQDVSIRALCSGWQADEHLAQGSQQVCKQGGNKNSRRTEGVCTPLCKVAQRVIRCQGSQIQADMPMYASHRAAVVLQAAYARAVVLEHLCSTWQCECSPLSRDPESLLVACRHRLGQSLQRGHSSIEKC